MKTRLDEVLKDLDPSTDKLLTQAEVVRECNKLGQNMSLRKLQFFITKKIIPKPIYKPVYRGKQAYYGKEFIIEELKAVHILKTIFHRSVDEIVMIASNKRANLQEVVSMAHGILDHLYTHYKGKKQGDGIAFMFVNQKFPQRVIDIFLEKVSKSMDIRTMDCSKFLNDAFDKINKEEE